MASVSVGSYNPGAGLNSEGRKAWTTNRYLNEVPSWVKQNYMSGNIDSATQKFLSKADTYTLDALKSAYGGGFSGGGGSAGSAGVGGSMSVNAPSTPGVSGTTGTDSASSIMQKLYDMRPQFVQQQTDLLNTMGPSSRAAVLAASPELAQASSYYQGVFSDPFGGALDNYQDLMRQAQAARGFEGGGQSLAMGEAKFLTSLAQQTRSQTAGAMANLGTTILGVSGLAQGPDLGTVGSLGLQAGSLALQEQSSNRDWWATLQSADLAKKMYEKADSSGGNTNVLYNLFS